MVLENYKGASEVLVQVLYTVVVIFQLYNFCETLVLLTVCKEQDCVQ